MKSGAAALTSCSAGLCTLRSYQAVPFSGAPNANEVRGAEGAEHVGEIGDTSPTTSENRALTVCVFRVHANFM